MTPVEELAAAARSGDRAALPRAITLLESTRADHRDHAQQLLLALMPEPANAMHVGITGVPGAGAIPHRDVGWSCSW
jgi:LAO/AO transport system kinase